MTPRLWQPLGGLESSVLPGGGEGGELSFSTAPRGVTGAWFGSGQASSPCKGLQCCPRAVSEAAGTCCQDCVFQYHWHPGLSPVPQLSHCTLQQAPGTSPAQCPGCLQPLWAVPASCPSTLPSHRAPSPCPTPSAEASKEQLLQRKVGIPASSSYPFLSVLFREEHLKCQVFLLSGTTAHKPVNHNSRLLSLE